jgi:hypothetical protein
LSCYSDHNDITNYGADDYGPNDDPPSSFTMTPPSSNPPTRHPSVTHADHAESSPDVTVPTPTATVSPIDTTRASATYMNCPVCRLRVNGRSQLIAHLRTMRDTGHEAALYDSNPVYQELRALHVMPCPLGCGAVYDGGRTGTSRHYDSHVDKRSCLFCLFCFVCLFVLFCFGYNTL